MPNDDTACLPDSYDTPWKEIVGNYFQDFMAFFFPVAHDNIDWQRGYEFLDQELARITKEAEIGDRRMDKLVKVWLLDGDERWVLIHIEVQGERKLNFPVRMYTYQYRSYDLKQKPVVGLAILADDDPNWRPSEYESTLWETRVLYQFKTVKLLDYLDRLTELETSSNPFAIVTLAHLQAKQTKNQPTARYQAKWHIIRTLYQRGFPRQKIMDLFRFIDWVLALPKEVDHHFWKELSSLEENMKMPYITSVERIGMEKGLEKGRMEGRMEGLREGVGRTLIRMIQRRFGSVPDWVNDRLAAADLDTLESWSEKCVDADALQTIFE